ncbi:MAG: OmpA family protein [Proteobacteria bacterium]|nr:OmpA family protein [Pseudomonadota bacterium]
MADELLAFRSLFFDRLRTSLSERPGVRFLGESVMMQSELLFRDTSIEMREGAEAPLATLARTLLSSSRDAPIGLDWILRVEMHADVQPLPKGSSFASEWNLSSRRAFIVANFLADQGVLEQNLAAVGFGSSRPLDPSGDQIAFRRNRRIEFHIVEK